MSSDLGKFHRRLGRHAIGQTLKENQFVLLEGFQGQKKKEVIR